MFGSLPSTRLRVFMRAPLALAAAVSPVLSLGLWASLPGNADNATFELAELPPLPALDPLENQHGCKQSRTYKSGLVQGCSRNVAEAFCRTVQVSIERSWPR